MGNHTVERIDDGVLYEFDKCRIVEMGKVPSASVINNHNSALNRVFDETIDKGYMSKHQLPMLRNEGLKSEKLPTITVDEYTTLHRGLGKWVREARRGNDSTLRHVLRY